MHQEMFSRVGVWFLSSTLWFGGLIGVASSQTKDAPRSPTIISIESVRPKNETRSSVIRYGLTRFDYEKASVAAAMFGRVIPIRVVEHRAYFGEQAVRCQIVGTSHEFRATGSAQITKGDFLSLKDEKSAENICVINKQVASQLFGEGDPVGQSIRVQQNFFTVVGVVQTTQPTSLPNKHVILIPLSTMRYRLGDVYVASKSGSFSTEKIELNEIRICLDRVRDAEKLSSKVKALLESIHPEKDYKISLKRPTP